MDISKVNATSKGVTTLSLEHPSSGALCFYVDKYRDNFTETTDFPTKKFWERYNASIFKNGVFIEKQMFLSFLSCDESKQSEEVFLKGIFDLAANSTGWQTKNGPGDHMKDMMETFIDRVTGLEISFEKRAEGPNNSKPPTPESTNSSMSEQTENEREQDLYNLVMEMIRTNETLSKKAIKSEMPADQSTLEVPTAGATENSGPSSWEFPWVRPFRNINFGERWEQFRENFCL